MADDRIPFTRPDEGLVSYLDLCIYFHPSEQRGRVEVLRYDEGPGGEPEVQVLAQADVGPFAFRSEVEAMVRKFVGLAANMLGWPG